MATLEESAKKLDFRGLMIGSIITAFGLVVGLFWKDAITETVDKFVPVGEGLLYRYIVAIIVTVIIVVVIYILMKTTEISKKFEDKAREKIKTEAMKRKEIFVQEAQKSAEAFAKRAAKTRNILTKEAQKTSKISFKKKK